MVSGDAIPSILLIYFRADYLARFPNESPTLTKLAAGGVYASMLPVFPTKTFPVPFMHIVF